MQDMMRITVRRGGDQKTFVVVKPPFPKVGEAIIIQDAEWWVTKTSKEVGIEVKFPARVQRV